MHKRKHEELFSSEPIPYYRIRYFDEDWNELDHLCVEGVGPRIVLVCIGTWLAVVGKPDSVETDAVRLLKHVTNLTVEVTHE